MKKDMQKIFAMIAICLGTVATAADEQKSSSLWSDVKSTTATGASSIWDVTKTGTVTAWEATKDGSALVWQKTKLGSETACGYRPSNLIGGVGAGAAATAGAATAAAGVGVKAAGFYTLTHAVTGAWMLGSTAGGASAAGTVGIMGGTAGVIGTVGTVIMAPATIIAGAVIGGGTAIFEVACYFAIDRLDDPKLIMAVLENLTLYSDKEYFELVLDTDGNASIYVAMDVDPNGKVIERVKYPADKLYIEDGVIKHKDWGPNTIIGKVGYVLGSLEEK